MKARREQSEDLKNAVFGDPGRHLKQFHLPGSMFWVMLLSVAITTALFFIAVPPEMRVPQNIQESGGGQSMVKSCHIPGLIKPSLIDLKQRELYVFLKTSTNVYSLDNYQLLRVLPVSEKKKYDKKRVSWRSVNLPL